MSPDPMTAAPDGASEERRRTADRRRHSLRTLTYCGLSGRGRRRQRRRADQDYYLDWYEPRLVYVAMGIMLLSSLDALLTLTLLEHGAYEANLLMARLLSVSVQTFVTGKLIITGAGVLFLLMHAHFRILGVVTGWQALHGLLPVYVTLIVYELVLLARIQ